MINRLLLSREQLFEYVLNLESPVRPRRAFLVQSGPLNIRRTDLHYHVIFCLAKVTCQEVYNPNNPPLQKAYDRYTNEKMG